MKCEAAVDIVVVFAVAAAVVVGKNCVSSIEPFPDLNFRENHLELGTNFVDERAEFL